MIALFSIAALVLIIAAGIEITPLARLRRP